MKHANESEQWLFPNARDYADEVKIELLSSIIMAGLLLKYKQQHSLKDGYKFCVDSMTCDSEGIAQMGMLIRKENYPNRD